MNSMRKAFQQAGVGGGGRQGERPRLDHKKMTDYYDQDGCIRREVYVEWPKQIVEALSEARVTRSRLRKLYEQVLATKARLRLGQESDTQVLRSGLLQLRRAAEHLGARQPPLPRIAVDFVVIHTDNVREDPKLFIGFFELFQSVYAYMPR